MGVKIIKQIITQDQKNNKSQIDPAIVQRGRENIDSLQANNYLHNSYENYMAIGNNFSKVDLHIMDSIEKKLIKKQEKREEEIYKILNIKNVDELNELISPLESQQLIDSTASELLYAASKRAFENLDTARRTKVTEQQLSNSLEEAIYDIMGIDSATDNKLYKDLAEGLGAETARLLELKYKKRNKPRLMNKYIEKLTKSLASNWRGEILERSLKTAIQFYIQSAGLEGSVEQTGPNVNAQSKQIKSDVTWELENHFTVGISAKNYNASSGGSFSIHSGQSLNNFYNLVNQMHSASLVKSNFTGIKKIVASFNKPNFKYNLINEAAFYGAKNISDTDTAQNLINFIKQCLPLFIGSQLQIKGDNINVDFFNINGKFVPISEILKDVFGKREFSNANVNIHSNYDIPWEEMAEKKSKIPVHNGEYYSSEFQKVGGAYGTKVYEKIKIDNIHLRVVLAKMVKAGN